MKCTKTSCFTIYDFMTDVLGLRNTELLTYALIYSFTRSGCDCYCSISYISERTGSSISTVKRAVNELITKGYLIKKKGKVCHYKANLSLLFSQGIISVSDYMSN